MNIREALVTIGIPFRTGEEKKLVLAVADAGTESVSRKIEELDMHCGPCICDKGSGELLQDVQSRHEKEAPEC